MTELTYIGASDFTVSIETISGIKLL